MFTDAMGNPPHAEERPWAHLEARATAMQQKIIPTLFSGMAEEQV
jgi:hypothetical protein